MKKLYRNDLIVLLLVLILCTCIPFAARLLQECDSTNTVVISHDGHVVCKIDLEDEGYFEVNGVSVQVKNMRASVTHSTCPDGLCMQMKEAENAGDSIICVPNRVSVKIVSDNEDEGEVIVAG